MALFSIIFAQPSYAVAGLLVVAGLLLISLYGARTRTIVAALRAPEHHERMLPGFSWLRLGIRLGFLLGAMVLLWIALLRPQYPLSQVPEGYEYSRDLIIAVDVSRSMFVEDCGGASRIESVRKKINVLMRSLQTERVALIVFAGSALVQCPFTKDFDAFSMFVDLLDPGLFSGSGTTSLAAALQAAASLYTADNKERKHKLLVIMTDGEDFSGEFEEAQRAIKDVGLQVSVIGIGSLDGAPVPSFTPEGLRRGYQRDSAGAVVISRLNEPLIKALTERFSGLYCKGTDTHEREVAALLAWVRAREAERCATSVADARGDLYMWAVGLAWTAMGVAWYI